MACCAGGRSGSGECVRVQEAHQGKGARAQGEPRWQQVGQLRR